MENQNPDKIKYSYNEIYNGRWKHVDGVLDRCIELDSGPIRIYTPEKVNLYDPEKLNKSSVNISEETKKTIKELLNLNSIKENGDTIYLVNALGIFSNINNNNKGLLSIHKDPIDKYFCDIVYNVGFLNSKSGKVGGIYFQRQCTICGSGLKDIIKFK